MVSVLLLKYLKARARPSASNASGASSGSFAAPHMKSESTCGQGKSSFRMVSFFNIFGIINCNKKINDPVQIIYSNICFTDENWNN